MTALHSYNSGMTRRVLLVAAGIGVVVLLAAGGWAFAFWRTFIGPPGPRNAAALTRLREAGYVPAEATDVFISDTHGGFHGDGDTLLVFACGRACLDQLKERVSRDYASQIARGLTRDWSTPSTPGLPQIQRTLESIASTDRGRRPRMPDLSPGSVLVLCGEQGSGPTSYCGNLFVLDYGRQRFWYMNIQA